jgi:hypothetical protein
VDVLIHKVTDFIAAAENGDLQAFKAVQKLEVLYCSEASTFQYSLDSAEIIAIVYKSRSIQMKDVVFSSCQNLKLIDVTKAHIQHYDVI